MTINIQNKAEISDRQVRKIEEKINKMKKYYDKISYVDLYIKSEGSRRPVYILSVQYGVPGKDVVVREKSEDLNDLISSVMETSKRQLKGLFGRD